MPSLNKIRKYLKAFKNYVNLNKSYLLRTYDPSMEISTYTCKDCSLYLSNKENISNVKLFYKNEQILEFITLDERYCKLLAPILRYLFKILNNNKQILVEQFLQEYLPKKK